MNLAILEHELKKSYGARCAYKTTNALGRVNIANIFTTDAARGLRMERCGSDGFRIINLVNNEVTRLSSAEGTLSQVCWDPEFVPAKAKRKRSDGAPLSVHGPDGQTYFGLSAGREHGKDVHKEIEHFVLWTPARFKAAHEIADDMTRAACCCIVDQGLIMIDSERIVGDGVWRCGSAFDVLCLVTKTGEVASIEVKTGSDGTFLLPCRKNPRMRAPYFNDIPNTPLNRARMQLLFNNIVGERSLGVAIEHSYVIHIPNSESQAVAFDLGPVGNKRDLLVKAIEEWRVTQHIEKLNEERLRYDAQLIPLPRFAVPKSLKKKKDDKKKRNASSRERSRSITTKSFLEGF